jgi:hypothetical protein
MRRSYIVVAHYADGTRVTDYTLKGEAHHAGVTLRRQGINAFVYPTDLAQEFKLDPRNK